MISPMPAVSRARPMRERAVNFSFITSQDSSIVRSIDSLPMQLTATGFAPSKLSAAYSRSHAPPVAMPDRVRKIQDFAVISFAPL